MCRQAGAHLVETGGADQRSPGAGGGAGPTLEQCKVHCASCIVHSGAGPNLEQCRSAKCIMLAWTGGLQQLHSALCIVHSGAGSTFVHWCIGRHKVQWKVVH